MIKDRTSLNIIIALVARASACTIAAVATMLAAGPASASYTGTIGINWGTDTNISSGPNNIQTVFDNALKPLGVKATITGAVADNTYTADNHVVGTVSTSGTVTGYTLSNYTGGDTFLQNISEPVGNQKATSSFTITFSSGIDLNSISFDYEIFPNIDCAAEYSSSNKTNCGGKGNPDLPSLNVTEAYTNSSGKSASALVFQRYGTVPGAAFTGGQGSVTNPDDPLASCSGVTTALQKDCGGGGTVVATTSTTPYNGTPGSGQAGDVTDHSGSTGAQLSGTRIKTVKSGTDKETAPQLLGTSGTVSVTVGKGVNSLTFNDWPATIAISQISFKVPEPDSWYVIAPGLLLFGLLLRRKRLAAWGTGKGA